MRLCLKAIIGNPTRSRLLDVSCAEQRSIYLVLWWTSNLTSIMELCLRQSFWNIETCSSKHTTILVRNPTNCYLNIWTHFTIQSYVVRSYIQLMNQCLVNKKLYTFKGQNSSKVDDVLSSKLFFMLGNEWVWWLVCAKEEDQLEFK